MGSFKYKARDKSGKLISGTVSADSNDAAAKYLRSMDCIPLSIQEGGDASAIKLFDFLKRVTLEDMNLFMRQLVTLQRAGLPLLTSLEALSEQATNESLKKVIYSIMTDIESGDTLSSALEKHPKVFSKLYSGMVKAGESSGQLDVVLERLAQLGEDEVMMRSRIKSATRYPMIVIVTMALGFLVIVGFIIPRFASLFSSFKVALPLPTQILLSTSVFVNKFWYLVILGFIGFGFGFTKFIHTKRGERLWDEVKLKVLIFGPLNLKIVMSRFTRVVAILLKSGLPVLHVLELVKDTVGNTIIREAVGHIKSGVTEGKGISESMKTTKIFPPMVIQMVASGEETGKIDELLLRVSEYYDAQVDFTLKNLTTLIEPILIFILGGMVLIMTSAVFLPMWNIMQVYKGG